jgi:hypothetical protein
MEKPTEKDTILNVVVSEIQYFVIRREGGTNGGGVKNNDSCESPLRLCTVHCSMYSLHPCN